MQRWIRAGAVGVAAGFVGGLFGVGGGVVVVPGLVLLLGFDQRRAAATSVAVIAVVAAVSTLVYRTDGAVDWPAAAAMLAGSTAGAYGGARVIGRIPEYWLARAFVAVVLVAALRLGFG